MDITTSAHTMTSRMKTHVLQFYSTFKTDCQMKDKTLLGENKVPGEDLKVRNEIIQKTLAI